MSVFDVAKYILEQTGPITVWKLQKLVYYSQVWSLVWDDQALFEDDFEAWANGPVVRALFNVHKGCLYVDASMFPRGDSNNLDDIARDTIDIVIRDYGKFSGRELSEITHSERPWKEARKGIPAGEPSENIIDRDVIIDFYLGLLNVEEN
ncbi:MAG: DUF4065 domain-containing protein [Synergistaceae bacterium]|jgi:uncharacterized phage-associated protein|nr:DUF4065 domain-containing protein [Synergistaceae bacterium]